MLRTLRRVSMLALAVACAHVAPAGAQDQPTVFVHGFNSDGGTWQGAATRLQTRLAIAPQRPSINWRDDFPSQASSLQSQLSSLPGSPVAVAHSNGGLASRQWSRIRALGGLVTIGTPNQGAPIASNLLRWAAFNDDLYYALSDLYDAFTYSVVDWSSVYEVIKDALQFISALSLSSVLDNAPTYVNFFQLAQTTAMASNPAAFAGLAGPEITRALLVERPLFVITGRDHAERLTGHEGEPGVVSPISRIVRSLHKVTPGSHSSQGPRRWPMYLAGETCWVRSRPA